MMVSFFLLRFPPEGPAAHANTIVGKFSFKKSIKESQPLGKRGFDYKFRFVSVQSAQICRISMTYLRKSFSICRIFRSFLSENYFHQQKVRFFYNGYKIATTFKISVNSAQKASLFAKIVRHPQENSFIIGQTADRQNENIFL
jgi:hypothetical protein